MAYSEKLANRIREALRHLSVVKEKKMFGGIAFMVDNKMCLTAGSDKIMCRIDPAIHEEVIKRKGCRTVIMKGREYRGYVYISEANLQTADNFNYWVSLALDFNKKAKSSKRKKSDSTISSRTAHGREQRM
jgi:TfoX/Sxy family transcriptional regulator of competence genes